MSKEAPLSLILELARTESPDDPFAFRFAPQTYTLRRPDGAIARLELGWSRELIADLEALRRPQRDPALVQRLGDLVADFLAPAGWRERAWELAAALADGRRVHLTVRSAAAELYALPWEILTLGSGGVSLAEHPGLLLRYAWPGTASAPEAPSPRPEGGRILFAWSAAGGPVPAAEHQRAIAAAARAAHVSFESGRDVIAHASLARLRAALTGPGAPASILHLLAHGGAQGSTFGLLLESDDGEPVAVDAAALRQVIGPAAGSLRLVVLAACHGGDAGEIGNHLGSVAQALHRAGVQAVVASRSPLSVAGSIALSEALYGALLGGPASLEGAFLAARGRLALAPDRGDAWSLQLYARPEDGDDARPLVLRPYRGLLAFDEGHARFFFGREVERREVAEDLARCVVAGKPRILLIAGASGTGKSSMVLAAAAPDIVAGAGPWPEGRWEHAILRPGEAPLAALEEALARRSERGQPFLLVVDQFEELFTHTADPGERQAFARRLWALARGDTGVCCLLTLRVDFLGRCGELVLDDAGTRLDRLAFDPAHHVLVPQMREAQLRAVIEAPAALCGLALQEGLTARLLADAGAEPGALPLLQYTLDRLWERREGSTLTLAAYEALGGVAGALEGRAEELCAAMSPAQLAQVRRIFLRLVHVGAAPESHSRRLAELGRLRPRARADDADFEVALATFIDARLLVQGRRGEAITVEVAHEALVRTWTRLHRWIDEDREKLGDLARMEGWVREWRDDGVLLMGNQLAHAATVARRYPDELDAAMRELLQASERRARFYTWLTRGAVLSLFGLVVTLALVYRAAAEEARSERERLRDQRDLFRRLGAGLTDRAAAVERALATVEARRLAQATVRQRLDGDALRLLVGVEALRATADLGLPPAAEALTGLYEAAADRPPSVALTGAGGPLVQLSLSRDGRRVLGRSEAGVALLWDVDAPARPRTVGDEGGLTFAELSPDGGWLLLAGGGPPRLATVDGGAPPRVLAGDRPLGFTADGPHPVVIDGDAILRWSSPAAPEPVIVARAPSLRHAALGVDRRDLLTITDVDGGGRRRRVRVTPLVGERPALDRVVEDLEGAAAIPGGGALLRRPGGALEVLRPGGGEARRIAAPPGLRGRHLDVSPDGRLAAVHGDDGRVLLVDLAAGAALRELQGSGAAAAARAGFTADGRWLALSAADGLLSLGTSSEEGPTLALTGHEAPITALAFAGRGDAFVSAAADGSVRRWRAAPRVPALLPVEGRASALLVAPGGRRVVAALARGVELVAADGDGERLRLDAGAAPASCLALDPQGRRLAASEPAGGVRLWDLERPDAPRRLDAPPPEGRACARFSPDGARLLTGVGGPTLTIHPATGEGDAQVIAHDRPVLSAMFTADGGVVGVDGAALLRWPPGGGAALVRALPAAPADDPLALAPDGEQLLVVLADGTVAVWRVAAAGPPLVLRHPGRFFLRAAFSPDGAEVIAGGGPLVRFRLAEPDAPEPLGGPRGPLVLLAFTPDGRLISVDAAGSARIERPGGDGGVVTLALPRRPHAAALDPDGRALALAVDGAIERWPLDPAALRAAACELAGRDLTADEWASIMTTPWRSTCGRAPGPEKQ